MCVCARRDDFFFFFTPVCSAYDRPFVPSPVWEIYESRPPSVPNLSPFLPSSLPLTHPFCPWKLIRNAVSRRENAPPPIHASQEF